MYKKVWFALFVCLLLLTACAGRATSPESVPSTPKPDDFSVTPPTPGREEPPINPYAPGKGDESMQRGEVFIDSQELLTLESSPLQYELHVMGSLPTPCHQLRVVIDAPDEQNRVQVQMFSLVDPSTICTQVLKPFDARIPLGSFASGTYTVIVNGVEAGKVTH